MSHEYGGGCKSGCGPRYCGAFHRPPKLEILLAVPDGGNQSKLDRLRKGPYRRSAPELVRALKRLEEIRSLGHRCRPFSSHSAGRVQALARFAATAKASAIERLPEDRRLATLVAFANTLEATALDDVLDLLDILITEMFSEATKAGEKARLRTLKDLDVAASQLGQACRLILDSCSGCRASDGDLQSPPARRSRSRSHQVDLLVRPPEDMYFRSCNRVGDAYGVFSRLY